MEWLDVLRDIGIMTKEYEGFVDCYGNRCTTGYRYTFNMHGKVPDGIKDDVMAILEKIKRSEMNGNE